MDKELNMLDIAHNFHV